MKCYIIVAILYHFVISSNGDAQTEILSKNPHASLCMEELKLKIPLQPDQKYCVMACIGVKSGNLNEDFSINIEYQMTEITHASQLNKLLKADDYRAVLMACQNVATGKDPCEAGKLADDCIKGEMVKRGMSH